MPADVNFPIFELSSYVEVFKEQKYQIKYNSDKENVWTCKKEDNNTILDQTDMVAQFITIPIS